MHGIGRHNRPLDQAADEYDAMDQRRAIELLLRS
jgi:hypothetical protein